MTKSPHSMQVVKREEKESKLKAFVLSEIAAGRANIQDEWNVVALSMSSPVVAALRDVISEFDESSLLTIRIVLASKAGQKDFLGFEDVTRLGVRYTDNRQFLDAHEQLVLGVSSSWTGDCMRRDPRKRDAFECHAADNCEAARWATRSFERIWASARPLAVGAEGRIIAAPASIEDVVAGESTGDSELVAATSRH